MIGIDVEELIELAAAGHHEEVVTYNRLHRTPHVPMECSKCLNIAAARMKVAQAEQSESHVVLYIP
jgi:hypothetical protein